LVCSCSQRSTWYAVASRSCMISNICDINQVASCRHLCCGQCFQQPRHQGFPADEV
jgi:hypothetical protein